jgi:predicted ATPase
MAAPEAFIRSLEVVPKEGADRDAYPLGLPALRGVRSLPLDPRVTIFVGENGSGKSTLVEGIAVAAGFNAEGGSANFSFATTPHRPELADHLRLVRGARRPRTGFFLRAESFFNVASRIDELDAEPGLGGPLIAGYGGTSLHLRSHGESFLALAKHRFGRDGLYILDEPEAALSPQGCIALLLRIHDLVGEGSQFLIATHSPLLMAYPKALIYQLTEDGPRRARYEELDHVRLTRDFLAEPSRFLDHLFADAR